jgi:hypothetical protein
MEENLSNIIHKLYDEFIELKNRMVGMDVLNSDSTDKSLIHAETFGTEKILLSISTHDYETMDVDLYVDIISLYNLGFKHFDTDIKFTSIIGSLFWLELGEKELSYLKRRICKQSELYAHSLYLSLHDYLGIYFTDSFLSSFYLLNSKCMVKYHSDDEILLKIRAIKRDSLSSTFDDLLVKLYLDDSMAFSSEKEKYQIDEFLLEL